MVSSGSSKGHVQNNVLAAENQEIELIPGKSQSLTWATRPCAVRGVQQSRRAFAPDSVHRERSWCRRAPAQRLGARQVGKEHCGLTVLQHLGSELLTVSGKEGNAVYCIFTTLPVNSRSISLLFRSLARASPLPAFFACCRSPDSSSNAEAGFANTLLVVLVDFSFLLFSFLSFFLTPLAPVWKPHTVYAALIICSRLIKQTFHCLGLQT